MKKKNIIMFILIILVIPCAIAYFYKKTTNVDAADVLNRHGFKISIITYDGTGSPETIGKPILVYESGLLGDYSVTIKGNYPSGNGDEAYEALMTKEYGLRQVAPDIDSIPEGSSIRSIPTTEAAGVGDLTGYDALTAGGPNNTDKPVSANAAHVLNTYSDFVPDIVDTAGIFTKLADALITAEAEKGNDISLSTILDKQEVASKIINSAREQQDSDKEYNHYLYTPAKQKGGCISSARNRSTGECDSVSKTRSYVSSERKILYLGSEVDLSEYYAKYEDSGTAEEMAKKYAGTTDLIRQYFGISINPMDLDKYYVQVEVVQRVLETDMQKQAIFGTFHVKTITGYDPHPSKWTKSGTGWTFEGQKCPDGYSVISNHDSFERTLVKNCKKCVLDCPDGYDEVNSGGFCYCHKDPETETSYNCRLFCNAGETASGKCGLFNLFTNCKSTTTTTYDDILGKWEYVDSYPTYTSCPCDIGTAYRATIYGTLRKGPSYIVVSRDYSGEYANPSYFLNFATNSCSALGAKHCILDDEGNCTNKYIYYIGPNIEKALVGPSSLNPNDSRVSGKTFPYTFSNSGWNGSEYTCGGGATGTGVQHFFFIDIPPDDICKTECAKEGSNTSDAYLKCAENYCEARVDYDTKGNARKRKKNCLLDEKVCDYKYGHAPGSKNSESVNSCNQSQIVKEFGSDIILDLSSRCNMTSDGKYLPNQKGVMVEPCIGDKVTDFDGDDKNDTIFDQRTYINKICKETVSFGFKDTSVLTLTKGSGFTYPIQQEGDKTCTYFVNLEQWKFDYASAPARDPEQRTRMQYVLDNFNQQVGSSSADKGMYYRNDFEGEGYGTTGFEKEGYDFAKTTVGSKENESLFTGDKVVTQNGMVVAKKSAMSSLESNSANVINSRSTSSENMTSTRLSTEANDTVTIVANGSIGSRSVNRYISNGTGLLTYTLEKVCISTDGLATVTKAPENEICFQTKEEDKTKNVYAEDKYYTSFKIETDVDQPINATASVGRTGSSDSSKYYNVNESCTYKISDGAACILKIETLDGGVKLGDNQYESARLKVNLYHDFNQLDIQKISIYDNNHEISGDEITLTNRNSRSMEVHNLVGLIVLKDGTQYLCGEETIDLYNPGQICGVSCSIEAKEETVYEIKSIGSITAVNYYTYTSAHSNPTIDILSRANSIPYEFMKPVYGSVVNGVKYIKLSEGLKVGETLFGYVTTGGNGSCNNYCYTNVNKGRNDCYSLFKPAETGDIHDYCYANWKTDANGFKDDEDCFKKCSHVCPNNKSNITIVENYCASYSALGFPDYEHCMNKCYKEADDTGDGDYLYRSVNVLDPFPNSQESGGIFEKGDRIVGKNWKFLSGYITDDSEDKTSITGAFANTKVEYVIDMTPENIRLLRKDTKDSDLNTEKNKRGVYAKLDRIQGSSSKVIEEYRSQFIHNSDFTDLFQTGHGDIQASFNPRTN